MTKRKKLQDTRVQLYKKNRLAGMNRYNAMRAAGYSHHYANTRGPKYLESVIESDMRNVAERQGLTDRALVAFAIKGMQATRLQTCDIYVKDENGKLKINKNSNDFIEVPDWAARHRFFNTICELSGRLKTQIEHSGKVDGPEQKIIIVYPQDFKKIEVLGERNILIENPAQKVSG